MRFWIREIAGWVLLLLGLFVFYQSYWLLMVPDHARILEGFIMSLIGIILFRGGIHLLKIAVAAQVCLETQEQMEEDKPKPASVPLPGAGMKRPVTSRR
jgi:hypothetical protein